MSDRLSRLLDSRPWLLADGATGTNYFAAGLQSGDSPELWNVEAPERVTALHASFIEAGADIILTNSFGGTRHRLKLHQAQDRVAELNRAAAALARETADKLGEKLGREVVVAGSIGPTGEIFEPVGSLSLEEGTAAFAEQAQALAEGGADVLWIETISSVEELSAAVAGAATTGLPVVCTLSFDTQGRTMMGVTGTAAAERLAPLGLAALGANCGNNIAETEAAVLLLKEGAPDTPIISKANAGIPEFKGDKLVYTGTPEVMGAHMQRMIDAGIDIIGGCCGTSTQHVAYMRGVLDGTITAPDIASPGPRVDPDAAPSREATTRRRRRRS